MYIYAYTYTHIYAHIYITDMEPFEGCCGCPFVSLGILCPQKRFGKSCGNLPSAI